jgi:hypothetical protein
MPLSPSDRAELDRLGVENVRQRLDFSGRGGGALEPGLGSGFGMTRGDVEEWLAARSREAAKLQVDILWWAKAAAVIGGIGILVTIAIAAASFVWSK